jgi:hypothetical protein
VETSFVQGGLLVVSEDRRKTMNRRRLRAVLLVAGCAPSLLISSSDAEAAPGLENCHVEIGRTSKVGESIEGYGSQSGNCGQFPTFLMIQRTRWYGWQTVKEVAVPHEGPDFYVRYNCNGTGTYTYRTLHAGPNGNKVSNKIRVTC